MIETTSGNIVVEEEAHTIILIFGHWQSGIDSRMINEFITNRMQTLHDNLDDDNSLMYGRDTAVRRTAHFK